MAVARHLAKPIQSRLESLVLQSAFYGLALAYLPKTYDYIPFEYSSQAELVIPIVRSILQLSWALAVGKRLSSVASHVALNSLKGNVWTDDEIVVVTGGSSGIGAMVVSGFVERGAKVAILDLQESKDTLGPNVSFYKCDVSSSSDINKAAVEIRKQFGEPTVLINNAGIGFGETILGASEARIQAVINVNLLAHFYTVREFLPSMVKKNKGHVVTVASMASLVTIASNVDYSCTKAAVLAFHEGLRQELDYRYDARLVRTSIIHPNWVRTPLTTPLGEHSKEFPKDILDPKDIADAIISQVVSGNGGQIFCPSFLSVLSGIRGFPHWMQESIRGSQKSTIKV